LDAHRLASQWSSNQQQLHLSLTSASPQQRQQEQQVPPQQPTPQPQQEQQQQLFEQAQQLQEWLEELRGMQSAAAAASLQIVHDPACSPQLLIGEALAQQHPLWLADYAAWHQQQTAAELQQQLLAQQQQQQQQQQRVLHVLLPSVAQLDIGGSATLAVAPYYAAAVQSAASILQLASSPSQQQPDTTSASHAADAAVQHKAASKCMPWPLTAAATAALLASPPGVLTEAQQQAVYGLGLGARLQALTAAVDLGQMLRLEAVSTEVGTLFFGCGEVLCGGSSCRGLHCAQRACICL
jgi:hypothetical protein